MVHAGCVFDAALHPSRTWMSGPLESVRWSCRRISVALRPRNKQHVVVGCLTSQQHASISQGRICSDNSTCCHTEKEVADPTFHLTQSQYTDTGPTSPSADPRTPGDWQGSHWSANFSVTGMTQPRKKSRRKRDSNPGSSLSRRTPYH